jgi:hypothetical protein
MMNVSLGKPSPIRSLLMKRVSPSDSPVPRNQFFATRQLCRYKDGAEMMEKQMADEDVRKRASEIGASLYEGAGVGARAQQIAEGVSETYRAAGEQVAAARDYVSSLTGDVEGAVRKNPLMVVLGALGVGMIIGRMRRR